MHANKQLNLLMTHAPIHVFVLAPPMLCWGFEKLVRTACPGIRVTGSADTLADAMHRIHGVCVDVMVVDLDEGYDPEALAQAADGLTVLLLTSSRSASVDVRMRHHVSAVVRKSDPPSVLLRALENAYKQNHSRRGDRFQQLPPLGRSGSANTELNKIDTLTTRERQLIFAVLCHATASGKVIASRLCISEHTLRNHLSSIYGKLGVQNRLSLHAFAVEHRLDSNPGFLTS